MVATPPQNAPVRLNCGGYASMLPMGGTKNNKSIKYEKIIIIALFATVSFISCQDDETIKVPIQFEKPKPTEAEQRQQAMQELSREGKSLVMVTNNSNANVEKFCFWYKHKRNDSNVNRADFEVFSNVFIPPGGSGNLKVSSAIFSKVTCLKNGKTIVVGRDFYYQVGRFIPCP